MSDTAAFFAKKKGKGKKKNFKAFNANKIDVSAVSSSTHVDAPTVSDVTELGATLEGVSVSADPAAQEGAPAQGGGGAPGAGENWDDEKLAANIARPAMTATAAGGGGATELLDMKALEAKRRQQDDVAERMRVEETRAQLAKAKEGMEAEAKRLEEEKKEKEKDSNKVGGGGSVMQGGGKPRFGAAAAAAGVAAGGGTGGKWVPPHLRGASGGGSSSRPLGLGSAIGGSGGSMFGASSSTPGSTFQRKVDTNDEQLFPDLATAEQIVTQQHEQEKAQKAYTKKAQSRQGTSAWGGAGRGTGGPASRAPAPRKEPEPAPEPPKALEPEPAKEEPAVPEPAPAPAPIPAPAAPSAAAATATAGGGLKKKKKKKKDLSTFKPS